MGLIEELLNKDDIKAYTVFKETVDKCNESNEYYQYFDEFLSFLDNKSAFVRVRGFILCFKETKWDTDGKLDIALDKLLMIFKDDKPSVVRQSINGLIDMPDVLSKYHVKISQALDMIELDKYKDTVKPLIVKDIERLLEELNKY